MQGCSYQAGAIILKKKIVNCEICLHIVSIFCSTEKLLCQVALCYQNTLREDVIYVISLKSKYLKCYF